ncbi:MAG: VOC family protein [Bacteroidota bacterium]
MELNNFIYADLSTYSPAKSIAFYKAIFGWNYYGSKDYHVAYVGNTEVAGLYETPQKFKQMRMPHFWMSYIQVNSVAETVQKVKKLGGIVELETDLFFMDKIALIRDPSGAGCTIYEGDNLTNVRTNTKANTLVWNELHVSDVAKVIPFYQGIFDWTIQQVTEDLYQIHNGNHEYISNIVAVSNEFKGKYEYWICTFAVQNLQATKKRILKNGGTQISAEKHRILCTDNSGEAFFYIQEV